MENKIPMNLQYFAEEAPAPETGAPEGTEAEESQEQQVEQPQEKTFTQAEVDKMVQKRLDRYDRDHQNEVARAKSEATKLAKMNKDQQKDYELQQAQQQAQDAQAKLARYQMRDVACKQLSDGGYGNPSDADIDLLVTDDAETTQANIESFLKTVERIRQGVRDELSKGVTPKAMESQLQPRKPLGKMNVLELAEMKKNDPQGYADLVRHSGY